jgi:hypothetical protein
MMLLLNEMVTSRSDKAMTFQLKFSNYLCFILLVEQSVLNRFFVGISFLLICGFMATNSYYILSIILSKDYVHQEQVIIAYLFMGSWLAIVVWFLISIFVYYIKQSGQPYKTPQHLENVKYISKIFLLWSLASLAKAVLSYYSITYSFD